MAPAANAGLPSAEQFLPPETLAYLTIPQCDVARARWSSQAPARAWSDPAMREFRQHFEQSVRTSLFDPLSRLSGLPIGRWLELAHGQFTVAVLPGDDPVPTNAPPAFLVVLDAGPDADEIADHLHVVSQGLPADSRTAIGDHEFLVLRLSRSRLSSILDQAFPGPADSAPTPLPADAPFTLHVGQLGSAVVLATGTNGLANTLNRLRNASPLPPPPAADRPIVAARINGAAFLAMLQPTATRARMFGTSGPTVWRLLAALGFSQLQSVNLDVRAAPEGWYLDLHLAIPSTSRRGLLQIAQFLSADASPPPFITADALRFRRARLRGPEAWSSMERTLQAIDPAYLGVLQLFTGYAGRTDDADFDFQKGVIDKLGDDWMTVSYPDDREASQTHDLFLVGSPQPETLLRGLRLVASPTYLSTFLPPDSPPPTRSDRTLRGHPMVTVTMPSMPWWNGRTGVVHLAHRDGYVAVTTSAQAMERFLTDAAGPSLAARRGVGEAAALSGVADGGFFSFRDERALALREDAGNRRRLEVFTASVIRWAALSETTTRLVSGVLGWLDVERLPPTERLAPFLGIATQSGRADAAGITLTTFRPNPPSAPTP